MDLKCKISLTASRAVLTPKQHLLKQVVNLGHTEELGELDLFDHLPGDALQVGQGEKDLPEPTP